MYFNKIAHPANFVFSTAADPDTGRLALGKAGHRVAIISLGADVHRVVVEGGDWAEHGSQAELATSLSGDDAHAVSLTVDGRLTVTEKATGNVVLAGVSGGSFGTCGQAWMFQFQHEATMQFYGLGEHSKGLEKSGQRVKFWNTDLFSDFAHCEIHQAHANPMYVALPWLIVKRGNHYLGILVHNPGAVFMDLASNFVWNDRNDEDRRRQSFYVGAPAGRPEIFLLVGPTLPELTRKLQTLVGRTPRPPLWALGHHQCRWGYADPRDLEMLDDAFRKHNIPCDGLWLDIDYMDRYKVFTFSPEHWRNDANIRRVLAKLAKRGRRVVPILDPGVKAEAGYEVCDDGLKADIFCRNPAGLPYAGFVWPGKTYLPDFSLPDARAWWTKRVRALASLGLGGVWIDMNDPAVGAVELDDMLFGRGTQPHAVYHNQYGLGMAQATRAGLLAARPEERPFLLSRSAYFSSSRHTAVWTGDNVSNWHHLRQSIPLSLGLALSGQPFNGPDVCGFMESTTPALAVAWYKAAFLFPFMRNHSTAGTRAQEPWTFGASSRIVAHYIRLRYRLRPYLYQLFVAQEETGEAILRPLFYDFSDTSTLPLGRIDDQFMIGPAILQAPLVHPRQLSRSVTLPGPARWFSAQDGRWHQGGRKTIVRSGTAETPLFVREGAILPLASDERGELGSVELHCFLRRDSAAPASFRYVCDDGQTFAYQRGETSAFSIEASVRADGTLAVSLEDVRCGYRPLRVRLVLYDGFQRVQLTTHGRTRTLKLATHRWRFTGKSLAAHATRWMTLEKQSSDKPVSK